jgi:hypothetical protein
VDVIAVSNKHASFAEKGLDEAKDRMQSDGKELGS